MMRAEEKGDPSLFLVERRGNAGKRKGEANIRLSGIKYYKLFKRTPKFLAFFLVIPDDVVKIDSFV